MYISPSITHKNLRRVILEFLFGQYCFEVQSTVRFCVQFVISFNFIISNLISLSSRNKLVGRIAMTTIGLIRWSSQVSFSEYSFRRCVKDRAWIWLIVGILLYQPQEQSSHSFAFSWCCNYFSSS